MLDELGVPIAAIATGHILPGIATVRIDNRAAMAELTAVLIARGYRRIALIAGNPRHSDSAARIEGYHDALAAHGITPDPTLVIPGRFDRSSGEEAAQALLSEATRPEAIMCSNDDMAAGVIAEAHRRGLVLPRDLAVTGFDDTTLAARIWPPLTTVRQPAEEMAFRAAERLIRTGDGVEGATDLIVPHAIVERESTPQR